MVYDLNTKIEVPRYLGVMSIIYKILEVALLSFLLVIGKSVSQ